MELHWFPKDRKLKAGSCPTGTETNRDRAAGTNLATEDRRMPELQAAHESWKNLLRSWSQDAQGQTGEKPPLLLLSQCVQARPGVGWPPHRQRTRAVGTGPRTHVSPLLGRKGPPWTVTFAEAPGADTRGQTSPRSPAL